MAMTAAERREAVLQALEQEQEALSASALAKRFHVSRQIIVGDVALLRAGGAAIRATPRGYVLEREREGFVRPVACIHTGADMEQELNLMVDYGCTVVDVIVEHPVYGQLSGPLELSSRYDVSKFIQKVLKHDAKPLSLLTQGLHLHTLRCPNEEVYHRVAEALREAGFLAR